MGGAGTGNILAEVGGIEAGISHHEDPNSLPEVTIYRFHALKIRLFLSILGLLESSAQFG